MTFIQTARRVIELATASVAAKEAYRKVHPWPWEEYGMIRLSDNPHEPTLPEETALRQFLQGQRVATQYMLVAVMYLGRGDGGADSLMEMYDAIVPHFQSPAEAVFKLTSKIFLGEYLDAGLKNAEEEGFDLDEFMFEKHRFIG